MSSTAVLIGWTLAGFGILCIYAALKGKSPGGLIKAAISTGKLPVKPSATPAK